MKKKLMKTRRTQPRIKGVVRVPSFSSLHPEIRKVILHDARKFNCSPSFVIATALAEFFKVRVQPRYFD